MTQAERTPLKLEGESMAWLLKNNSCISKEMDENRKYRAHQGAVMAIGDTVGMSTCKLTWAERDILVTCKNRNERLGAGDVA